MTFGASHLSGGADMSRESRSASARKPTTQRRRALGLACVLGLSALSLACGSSGGGADEPANEWDAMEWNAGSWASRLVERGDHPA
jgi:hypothetical protein